jgi:hypothetical protein
MDNNRKTDWTIEQIIAEVYRLQTEIGIIRAQLQELRIMREQKANS